MTRILSEGQRGGLVPWGLIMIAVGVLAALLTRRKTPSAAPESCQRSLTVPSLEFVG